MSLIELQDSAGIPREKVGILLVSQKYVVNLFILYFLFEISSNIKPCAHLYYLLILGVVITRSTCLDWSRQGCVSGWSDSLSSECTHWPQSHTAVYQPSQGFLHSDWVIANLADKQQFITEVNECTGMINCSLWLNWPVLIKESPPVWTQEARHTACRIASAVYAALSNGWGVPQVPPPPSRPGMGYPPPPPPRPGTGYHHPDLGWGTPPPKTWDRVPPHTWDRVPPTQTWDGVPPSPHKCGLKVLPSPILRMRAVMNWITHPSTVYEPSGGAPQLIE